MVLAEDLLQIVGGGGGRFHVSSHQRFHPSKVFLKLGTAGPEAN
jgi:hypothetical protein